VFALRTSPIECLTRLWRIMGSTGAKGYNMVDWNALGRKAASAVWGASDRKLAHIPHEPDRVRLEHVTKGRLSETDWSAYRCGYRDELHCLNLSHEAAQRRPALGLRCECGAALAHVVSGRVKAQLCPVCDAEHYHELTDGIASEPTPVAGAR